MKRARLVFALALAALAGAACDPVFDVSVHVTACADGQPIVGARVVSLAYDADVLTDPDGTAHFGGVGELRGAFDIAVDKPGWLSKVVTVDPPDGASRFHTDVCLEPGGP
ncbi:MAG TPA: hypothetical protein VN903_00645 [Polyangia bacterium]|nr:hypothetical protein [Polyangia bacterium]